MKKRISINALARSLAKAQGVSTREARERIEMVFAQITEELKNKNDVSIDGFGEFVSIVRHSKKSKDPFTLEDIIVPGKVFVSFAPDIHLKEVVNEKEP